MVGIPGVANMARSLTRVVVHSCEIGNFTKDLQTCAHCSWKARLYSMANWRRSRNEVLIRAQSHCASAINVNIKAITKNTQQRCDELIDILAH